MAQSTISTTEATEDERERHTADSALPENAALTVPASANHGEAAAIAAAVGAHLRDRAVAGAASDDTPEQCNRWKLCGRLGGREPPREVTRGEEWKAAGRARW